MIAVVILPCRRMNHGRLRSGAWTNGCSMSLPPSGAACPGLCWVAPIAPPNCNLGCHGKTSARDRRCRVHADEVQRAVAAECHEVAESLTKKASKFGSIHLTRGHRPM